MNAEAWAAFSALQDHVNAIRDRVGLAADCLHSIPVRHTIPEEHFEALATDLDRLAAGIRDHIAAVRRAKVNHAEAEANIDAVIADVRRRREAT